MTRRWTTGADIAAKVRRRWDDGSLLTAAGSGAQFPGLEVPISGPLVSDLGAELEAVQGWVGQLESGSRNGRRYAVQYRSVGGREFGRNQLPARAVIASFGQAWELLGVRREVEKYLQLLQAAAQHPAVRAWALARPHRALGLAGQWPALLAAYDWLDGARGTGRYLREISAPGVDTKFVESHRSVLAEILDVPRSASGFITGLGLRGKPELLRLRFGPGALRLPTQLTEATLRAEEAAQLTPGHVQVALIVENETTFLTVPVPTGGVVLWGKGFEVSKAGRLPWLHEAEAIYWGDLDTHGFAILNQLRAWLPQTRSLLMDRESLERHRDRWGRESSPTHAQLDRLDEHEAALYADLVADRLGERVRLEQERLSWDWVAARLPR